MQNILSLRKTLPKWCAAMLQVVGMLLLNSQPCDKLLDEITTCDGQKRFIGPLQWEEERTLAE